MLEIVTATGVEPLRFDDYYIQEETNGRDSVGFSIPTDHGQYRDLAEEVVLIDSDSKQRYSVKAMDDGPKKSTCKAALDLCELEEAVYIDYNSGSNRAFQIVGSVIPESWTVIDRSYSEIRRTIKIKGGTALEVIDAVCSTFGLCVRYDNDARTVTLVDPESFTPAGVYLTEELNLKACNRKGSTGSFATRLYMRGKDGCTFASVNGGKDFVDDHSYSDKVVSTVWIDERYSDPEEMLSAARRRLATMAKPVRSYTCDVIDLAKATEQSAPGANEYAHLSLSLFSVVALLDPRRRERLNHQVVRYKRWPMYPDRNEVTLSTAPITIQSKVNTAYQEVTSPNSNFKSSIQSLIGSVSAGIAGYDGGNLVITHNAQGKPNGFRIMDTDSEATAKKVLWVNLKGVEYGEDGVNGEYKAVWSFEKGGFIATWLVAGIINAVLIQTGILKDKKGNFFADLDNGVIRANLAELTIKGKTPEEVAISGGRNLLLNSGYMNITPWNDIGKITDIDYQAETITVVFDDREAEYDFTMLSELELAYAMTVHKSQGSEYRAVILTAWSGSRYLLTRSVLYTAVTRAKDLLIVVGNEEVIAAMVGNDHQTRRYSGLKLRLQQKREV